MAIHFISDLHLSEEHPELAELFERTLDAWGGQIDALYILGDLFEYWVGDDDALSPFNARMLDALARFSAQTPLYVMHGNRDFLLGEGFEHASGARLLADPTLIEAYGRRLLLSHGDVACTADTAYQTFRALRSQAQWQAALLARPLAERHAIARAARTQSEGQKAAQGYTEEGDVTAEGLAALLEPYGWPTLVHGHTHRPGCYPVADGKMRRWVIADWHDGAGGYLRLDENGLAALGLGAAR
ncbi:UDP-2,3-diacylglucosamine diphosphatase [Crenobacter caeni]|uniref:UDP-2,3-diacylglucosamine hydrolase n=1 Tax=Crenobacter caeni TaxID=2705474 RepID=A0A6B2KS34_9NEIS|nr:UDP-2,3-diacylglucosamine diphosphatase [Crenobacter caeni]NDV12900.1 UDP-2,3-diacylglucosamine diphosphatase [Crenobacter caeni]